MGSSVKRIAIVGSTGSIGRQTLDVVRTFPDHFRIVGLAAGQNLALLARQMSEFKPEFVYYEGKRKPAADAACAFLPIDEIACHPEVDLVLIAASGQAGLSPTLAAVKAGKSVALANKESLVTAGEVITAEAKRSGARILPVDSEHSAIWQCLRGEASLPARIILTASGGPFRRYSPEELGRVTVEQALKHPSWRMGKKVTIDSATLMNKGLEVIEARWLFNMAFENIQVIVHPQSIIHSMVEFADGSLKAQLSHPDMRFPIQYALFYPERLANPSLPRLDWDTVRELTFETPDFAAFPCLRLAIKAGRQGGTCPAVLCAADEVAVDLFLARRIGFTDIARLVEETLARHQPAASPTIEEILAADTWARNQVAEFAARVDRC